MAAGDSYADGASSIADAGTFTIDPADAETGAIELREFHGGGAAEVHKEIDVDGDGTYEIDRVVDTFAGAFYSQENQVLISDSQGTRVYIKNTSGASAAFGVDGVEVPD